MRAIYKTYVLFCKVDPCPASAKPRRPTAASGSSRGPAGASRATATRARRSCASRRRSGSRAARSSTGSPRRRSSSSRSPHADNERLLLLFAEEGLEADPRRPARRRPGLARRLPRVRAPAPGGRGPPRALGDDRARAGARPEPRVDRGRPGREPPALGRLGRRDRPVSRRDLRRDRRPARPRLRPARERARCVSSPPTRSARVRGARARPRRRRRRPLGVEDAVDVRPRLGELDPDALAPPARRRSPGPRGRRRARCAGRRRSGRAGCGGTRSRSGR